MHKPFFLTTAIDYTNGAPHIGHAYEKVLADVIARTRRLEGAPVFFLTGVDQHGQKVQQSAEKRGVPPQQFVAEITAQFVALWERLDIRYDRWAATTDPLHKQCVRAILQKLWDDKDPATGASRWLYRKTGRGWYSIRQEQFLTDKDRNAQGEFGPEWQPVEEREEENFYFRLRACKAWLRGMIEKRSAAGRPFVLPEFRVAELLNSVDKIEADLCVSRPASRLRWGIPFPESFGEGFVTYVWFDALANYITFAGFDPTAPGRTAAGATPAFGELWPALHIIGKDILVPAHGIYWPCMLHALGFADEEMPTLLVHGWWNLGGAKMSKSTGAIVDPAVLADRYGSEALRYYLMSDITTGRDADFSEQRLVQRYNTDLANVLGNLLNRTLTMAQRYRDGRVQAPPGLRAEVAALEAGSRSAVASPPASPREMVALRAGGIPDIRQKYADAMRTFDIARALAAALALATDCNELIDQTAPWKLAKDTACGEQLDAVLYHLADTLRLLAIFLSPVLPRAAHAMCNQLNWQTEAAGRAARFALAAAKWGGLPDGHLLGKPVPLFPRLDQPAA